MKKVLLFLGMILTVSYSYSWQLPAVLRRCFSSAWQRCQIRASAVQRPTFKRSHIAPALTGCGGFFAGKWYSNYKHDVRDRKQAQLVLNQWSAFYRTHGFLPKK